VLAFLADADIHCPGLWPGSGRAVAETWLAKRQAALEPRPSRSRAAAWAAAARRFAVGRGQAVAEQWLGNPKPRSSRSLSCPCRPWGRVRGSQLHVGGLGCVGPGTHTHTRAEPALTHTHANWEEKTSCRVFVARAHVYGACVHFLLCAFVHACVL